MMDKSLFIYCGLLMTILINIVLLPVKSCEYPEELQNSKWMDSSKGEITFTDNHMSGWSVIVYSTTITEWTCLVKNDDFVVSKSAAISLFGQSVTAYLCQRIVKHSDELFTYYQLADPQKNAYNERVYITTEHIDYLCDVCNPQSGPNDGEYSVLYKHGSTNVTLSSGPSTVECNPCQQGTNCTYNNATDNIEVINSPDEGGQDGGDEKDNENDSDKEDEENESNVSEGAKSAIIVGSVIGALVVLCVLTAVFIWIIRQRK